MALQPGGWGSLLTRHAADHKFAAVGLGAALLAVLVLLGQSLLHIAAGDESPGLRYAMLGGLAGFSATALGALPALALRSIPQKVEDVMLGLAAGMMLAASAFSLLLPGLEAGANILNGKGLGAAVVVLGMALDGLYAMMAEEEKAIRKDPLGASTSLIKKVFGTLTN